MFGETGNVVNAKNYCPECNRYLKARNLNDIIDGWPGRSAINS